MPPKLLQAVQLWQTESNARDHLKMSESKREAEAEATGSDLRSRFPNAAIIATG